MLFLRICLLPFLSFVLLLSCRTAGTTIEPSGSILDIVTIDTIVVVGTGDMKEQYASLFNTGDGLTWLPNVSTSGDALMIGYDRMGRIAVQDTLGTGSLDINDEGGSGTGLRLRGCAVTPSYYVIKSFNYVLVYKRRHTGNHAHLMGAVKLPRSLDNLNIINDSMVVLSTWYHRGKMKSTECGAIATLNLKTLALTLMDMPFTNGLFFTFRQPFSCHTTIRNSVVFIDPTNYDIHLRNVLDTTSRWQKVGAGNMQMIDGLHLARYRSDSTTPVVSPLLKHALGLDDIPGQRIVYTACIDDRYLLVCKTASAPDEKSDNITYWDLWDFEKESAPTLLRSNLIDTDLTGSAPCSKSTFPLLADDLPARSIGGGLSAITILPPFDVTCRAGVPVSDLKGIIDDYLSDIATMPLSLVIYRLHPPDAR